MSISTFSLRSIFTDFLAFLFPPVCFGCETIGTYLCPSCKKKLKSHPEICPVCNASSPHFTLCVSCASGSAPHYPLAGLIIGFSYTTYIKKAILSLKFSHRSDVAFFLADMLAFHLITHEILRDQIDQKNVMITYVPSHRIRKHFVKGYNQSELLAKHIASRLELPFGHLTTRIKHTRSQVHLTRKQRRTNLIGAFGSSSGDRLRGDETIIIIDDITTTGSTILQVATQIKQQYPNSTIRGAVVARNMS